MAQLHYAPRRIDPATNCLEAATCDEPGQTPIWRQLVRITPPGGAAFPNDAPAAHFFGLDSEIDRNQFLLVYDQHGIWSYTCIQSRGEWYYSPPPDELVGRGPVSPSVRVVFDNEEQARDCYHALTDYRRDPDSPLIQGRVLRTLSLSKTEYAVNVAQEPTHAGG